VKPRRRVLGEDLARFSAAVIGHPVAHSLSPRIHDAAYAALGLDWRYGAFDVAPGETALAIREAGDSGLVGLSVTTPLKFEAAEQGARSEDVEAIGAANTVVYSEQGARVHNTDGEGLLDDLRLAFGFDAAHRRCGVIGSGATARAIVRALDVHGAAEVVIVAGGADERAVTAAALAPRVARLGLAGELRGLDLVIYAARPARGGEPALLAAAIGSGQLAVDVNYHPRRSAFLEACAKKGAETRNGLGMLVQQAARQVELFTGSKAPLAAMRDALGDPTVATTFG
jgi:shikimate dehydrogenase